MVLSLVPFHHTGSRLPRLFSKEDVGGLGSSSHVRYLPVIQVLAVGREVLKSSLVSSNSTSTR